MRRLALTIALLLALTGCSGDDSGPKTLDTLHRDSFEAIVGTWPLTVDEAIPVCGTKNPQSLGVKVGGTTYALNGTGKTWEGWADLHAIWAPDPNIPGGYLNEGDLLDFVAQRC